MSCSQRASGIGRAFRFLRPRIPDGAPDEKVADPDLKPVQRGLEADEADILPLATQPDRRAPRCQPKATAHIARRVAVIIPDLHGRHSCYHGGHAGSVPRLPGRFRECGGNGAGIRRWQRGRMREMEPRGRLTLLGPFALRAPDGRECSLPAAKQRALIAALALAPGGQIIPERRCHFCGATGQNRRRATA